MWWSTWLVVVFGVCLFLYSFCLVYVESPVVVDHQNKRKQWLYDPFGRHTQFLEFFFVVLRPCLAYQVYWYDYDASPLRDYQHYLPHSLITAMIFYHITRYMKQPLLRWLEISTWCLTCGLPFSEWYDLYSRSCVVTGRPAGGSTSARPVGGGERYYSCAGEIGRAVASGGWYFWANACSCHGLQAVRWDCAYLHPDAQESLEFSQSKSSRRVTVGRLSLLQQHQRRDWEVPTTVCDVCSQQAKGKSETGLRIRPQAEYRRNLSEHENQNRIAPLEALCLVQSSIIARRREGKEERLHRERIYWARRGLQSHKLTQDACDVVEYWMRPPQHSKSKQV